MCVCKYYDRLEKFETGPKKLVIDSACNGFYNENDQSGEANYGNSIQTNLYSRHWKALHRGRNIRNAGLCNGNRGSSRAHAGGQDGARPGVHAALRAHAGGIRAEGQRYQGAERAGGSAAEGCAGGPPAGLAHDGSEGRGCQERSASPNGGEHRRRRICPPGARRSRCGSGPHRCTAARGTQAAAAVRGQGRSGRREAGLAAGAKRSGRSAAGAGGGIRGL